MKIKPLTRNSQDYTRKRSQDIFRIAKNANPEIHPFERAREYTRALNATKLERVFAKPFVGAMSGHADGVYSIARHPSVLSCVVSGSGDGEMRVWNLIKQETVWKTNAHKGFLRGLCINPTGSSIVSVGDDKTVKLWDMNYESKNWLEAANAEPRMVYSGKYSFQAVDHHFSEDKFAAASSVVNIWDLNKSDPIAEYQWGADTITSIKFNRSETNVFGACGNDRTIILYDIRSKAPLSKLVMNLRTNSICWNPLEPYNFVAANEDNNCYYFDMRNMKTALHVYQDHVSAVMDVDFSPTGNEFVSGSYDCTLRIFNLQHGHSREVYHTKRMQRIFSVKYSLDSKFVLSGSDDTNIRIWKAKSNEKLGLITPRERNARDQNDALKAKFKHMPEIRRIDRHRHVPMAIHKAQKTKREMISALNRRTENERAHSAPGTVPYAKERKKHVLTVEE